MDLNIYYDADKGVYRNIKEAQDDLCTLDSYTFYDKRAGEKFVVLPSSINFSRMWSNFWLKKDKANSNLIKACKEGNLKNISKLLNKFNEEPEKIADIDYCDK